MNWGDWTPQENILHSILEVLQEALIPDNEIQKNVQQKLNFVQNISDFTYYLLFIISNPSYSEEIRSLSGILLKNNINSLYDSISQEYLLRIRQECLRLLQDPCKDIRISISNVLVMLAKDNLETWPELVPFLINAFDASNEFSEIALNTLFKICEELIRNNKSDEEIYGITRKVFPRLNELLAQEKCSFHHDIIRLVNQFLQEYFTIVKQSLDLGSYLRNIIKYADSEDVEMQKQVSMTFHLYLDNTEDSLLPHLHEIMLYLLAKTQHKDSEVALQACEFWFTATKLSNCKELLSPYMEKLIPILLKNMKYSDYELMVLKDCLGNDSNEKDLSKDIYRYQNKDNGDEECYSDDEDNFNEEVDDCYIGWTLRKCSAASLDGIAVRFREDLLPLLVPYLNEILSHQDYYVKESAILALGAVAEGCMMGLKPYLPFLINYLINSMNDEHSVIRVITCWTLGRYVPWIINSDPSPHAYFIPVMTVLLKHFIDDNKRVQRAAISAFCIFQETAQAKLIPYIDIILEGFEQGFQRFQYRSLYLLYDAIGALAQSVGNQLSKPEYINKLMPQLMHKFSQCDNYSDDNFIAVLECLSNIIPALEISFLPYSEVVYWHCLKIITDTIRSTINYNENPREHDIPDKEPMNVAHDVLYSMALGLKNHFIKYVMNSNLLCLLHSTMMENMSLIRQTAIALYGELIILCFPYLSTTVSEYIPILIKNLDEKHEGVCNNAAWALGKLSSVMGSSIQPFISDMIVPFVNILRNSNLNRPMFRTIALSFCIICYVSNDINVPDLDFILKNCCMLIRNVKDSEEKDLAFRGLCKAVIAHPSFFKENFMYFCDAVASWNSMRLDLKENIKSILASFKEQCGEENWTVFYQQCPEPLKMRLISLKCPWHLISFLARIVIERTRKRCKKQPVQCGFNPSENVYEPLKLMHTVIEVINEVCFNYKSILSVQNRQNMAVSYPLPAPEDVYCVVSMSALKNSRRKMEDRFIVIHDLNTIFTKQDATPSHYYAVFDGHNGEHAAVYSVNHLHQYLAESTNFTTNPEQAIEEAFSKTDSMFLKKCRMENISGGTTVVCALLLPKEKTLYVAWVGDSQAVLVGEGKILPCVVPHRPDREDEHQRITKDGGIVIHYGVWRVNGQLGVSRAIGDLEHKPYVTAVPEMVKIPLGGDEEFIVLASDGLWDFVSRTEVAKTVYDAVYSDPEKAQGVSRELVQLAKQSGSVDNISVIVVFLRDPHQISAGPRWNNRLVSMDTLDNANNPFAIPNKTNNVVDSITAQTGDGLLLNYADALKKSDDLPNNDLIKMLEKSNCDRLSPDFDKEDNLGPETNVDNPDSAPASPNFDLSKRQQREAINNNQNCNPFNDIEKSLELNLNLKKGTFEGLLMSPTEEECVQPPITNAVHNVSQLIDAGAESDSEDEEEWNYVRGEEANKENAKPLQLSSQVAEEEEEDDIENEMSQLNPNAAEFIPSPARAVASPLGRLLDEDQVLSRSPKKPPPAEVDLNVPEMSDFEKDISQKPHETEAAFGLSTTDDAEKPHENGHQNNFNNEMNAINALNSRLDEFHFGPNAAPFTPAKLLDQSEASSTRANFGDESEMTLGTSFNDSVLSQDQNDFVQKDDPMSMSFHQDRSDDSNLFDLNKVHMLPENVDEFIASKDENTNSLFDDTISDLTEHYPLGKPEEFKQTGNEFTTDLDHDDQTMEHHQNNLSSTPKDNRSKSPSELQTPTEDERAFSSRNETPTSIEEASVTSSVGESSAAPKVEESIEAECRSKSPFERHEVSSPFEEERLISPTEEHKLSSPYEEKEMYSTEEEKDICSPVEEKDICNLMSKQNEPQNEEKEVSEEKDLFSEKDIIQEEKYLIEEKQFIEDKESVSEKEVTEEKYVFEEKYISSPEPQRDISSPVEAAISPDLAREVVSPVQEKEAVVSSDLVREVISPVQEKEAAISPDLAREVISPVQEKEAAISPVQEKEAVISPDLAREVISPVQEKETAISPDFARDVISPVQEDVATISPDSARDLISPVQENEAVISPDSARDVISPVQEQAENEEKRVISPVQEKEIIAAVVETETAAPTSQEIVSSLEQEDRAEGVERQIISPVQDEEISSPVQEERDVYSPFQEQVTASPVQDEEITSLIQEVQLASPTSEQCSMVEGEKAVSPLPEQENSNLEIKEDDFVPVKPSAPIDDLEDQPSEVTTTCDNLESSQQKQETVAAEQSNDELPEFETEKSEEENAKENLESVLQLDNSNSVLSSEEKCVTSEILVDESVNKNESLCDISMEPEKSVSSQLEQTEESVLTEQSGVPSALGTTMGDALSQLTPEADQLLISDPNIQCSLNTSASEISSVSTTDVKAVFNQSLIAKLPTPISPNLSLASAEITSEAVNNSNDTNYELLKPKESIDSLMQSPMRDQQQNLSTSTPIAKKLEVAPISAELKSSVEDKTLKTKEADKKTTKSKITPSTTAKKALVNRTLLTSAKTTATPSPKPAPKSASKTSTATSKLNSNTKTETAASKVASKPLSAVPKSSSTSAAPKPSSTTAKVPPSSRTNLKTALPKTTGTNSTTKPAAKPSTTGAIKKTEGSSNRSATSTGVSKTASTGVNKTASTGVNKTASMTARSNLTSARSATSTASTAAPKPRPNTLKPAPTRTVAAPKPTTTTAKPATSAPRVPLTSRTAATKTSSSLATKEVSKTLSKPRSVTDKQVKETANKLTAATRVASKTTVTKKTEVAATSRTTTTTSNRAPIKRPADTSKTATTKLVGKPKQNGVAPVVTEKIIVNNGTKELDNIIDQFVKDNSPVDNKLIIDKLSESAAN